MYTSVFHFKYHFRAIIIFLCIWVMSMIRFVLTFYFAHSHDEPISCGTVIRPTVWPQHFINDPCYDFIVHQQSMLWFIHCSSTINLVIHPLFINNQCCDSSTVHQQSILWFVHCSSTINIVIHLLFMNNYTSSHSSVHHNDRESLL